MAWIRQLKYKKPERFGPCYLSVLYNDRMIRGGVCWIACVCLWLAVPCPSMASAAYVQTFQACSTDKPCAQTYEFHVDPLPKRCCILWVTYGDGQGRDEVQSYEVLLNNEIVLPSGHARKAHATVTVQTNNTIKVVLTGNPGSTVLVLITHNPRESG
jgi:hypothetical protein